MSAIRWGILGCGRIARNAVAPAIKWSSNGSLHAIGSRTEQQATTLAHALGAPRAYGTYRALLDDPEIDAVYIGLPNGLHEEWSRAAAAAGKHVLCEKSLALDLASASRIAEAFRSRGLRLIEAFMYRHHPQWSVVRAHLAEIGELRIIQATFTSMLDLEDHRFTEDLGGGALFDLTCYGVNLARWICGHEPLSVTASAELLGPGVDASTTATLDFGGILATVTGSLRAARQQSVILVGSEGTIELTRPFSTTFEPTSIRVNDRWLEVAGANHYLHQVEHFARLVLEPQLDSNPAEDGVANIAVCSAIRRAHLTGNRQVIR